MAQLSEHVKNVCKIGQGAACCRYLMAGPGGFECAKIAPAEPTRSLEDAMHGIPAEKSLKQILDERVLKGTISARGDNCEGRKDLN
jgi:hypothetical protein